MNTQVSVLMPVYNGETTIEAAVRSVSRQTLTEFELIIVDDGSSDATPDLLQSLASNDDRIRLIFAPHRGIIHTLNAGIATCASDLIARMDADDISHPRRLELQANLMTEHPDISVCASLVRMFPRKSLLGGLVKYEQWLNSLLSHDQIARDIFIESPMAHPSVMYRKSEAIHLGGYQERGWPEDYDLWLRYHAAGKRFAKIPETLLYWRQGEGRLTFTDPRYCLENFLRTKAHYLAKMLAGDARPVVLWGAGRIGRRLSKHLIREGVHIESFIDIDTKKIGNTMRGISIVGREYLDNHTQSFVIAAVGSTGARKLIREHLTDRGLLETQDFVCAA